MNRKRAFEKLNSMKTHIGYPQELLNEDNLRELYDGVMGDSYINQTTYSDLGLIY